MSEADEGVISISTIEQAVEHLSLEGVRFYGLSAQTADDSSDDTQGSGNLQMETAVRLRGNGVDYRCRSIAESGAARISVDAAIQYSAEGPIEISESAVEEFGDNVAAMALYPYLRQAVQDMGMRVGYTLTLPMIQRGQLSFADEPGAD